MFFSNDEELEYNITHGKFKQALEHLNSIKKEKSLSDDEVLIGKYIQSFIYLDSGNFKKGVEIAEEMMNDAQEKFNYIRELDAIIARAENSISLALFNDSLDLISQGELLLNNIEYMPVVQLKYRESYLLYLKGRVYRSTHNILEGIQSFKKAYKIRRDLEDKYGLIWILLSLGVLTYAFGDLNKGYNYCKKSLALSEELNVEIGIMWNLIHIGWIKFHLRDLKSMFYYANKCLSICENKDYKSIISHCSYLMGYFLVKEGDLNKALSYFEKILEINKDIEDMALTALSYFSIGSIFQRKGELRKSLKYYMKSLDTPIAEDKARLKPIYFSAIGKVYGELGDFSTAKIYLLKALKLLKEKGIFILLFHNFSNSIAKTYHYLINLSIENNSTENVEEYLKNLYDISIKNPEVKQIKQIYYLNKAIILKSKLRLRDKMQAAIILKEICNDETVDQEILIEAMVNLCEILIYELELTGDMIILQEIEELCDKLLKISQTQYLYELLAETYFFKAKISLIKLDIDTTRILLTKAQKIANKHDLRLLANKISNEHDSLLVNLEEWEDRVKRNVPLQERINESKHEFLFSKMISTKIKHQPKEADMPIYLVILSIIDGHCLYNRAFEDISLFDGDLIAGFISAINMFGKEAFSSSGSIDRIKHGEYLIIFRSKENLLYGYVFKGQSYSAITKLENLVVNIENSENISKELSFSANNYIDISNKIQLIVDQLCDQTFLRKNLQE